MKKIAALLILFCGFTACNDQPDIQPRKSSFFVFPNPLIEFAYITFENPGNNGYTVAVFNPAGEIIFERNEDLTEPYYQVDVSGESKGTYHVVLRMNKTTEIRKCVKI